jgi:hypothetical protein
MNKYKYTRVLQGQYGMGWEDITEAPRSNKRDIQEQRRDLLAYRKNAPEYAYRIITRREPNNKDTQQ